jgi:hypothetical protein
MQQKRLYTHRKHTPIGSSKRSVATIVSSTSSIGGFSPRQQCLGLFSWPSAWHDRHEADAMMRRRKVVDSGDGHGRRAEEEDREAIREA